MTVKKINLAAFDLHTQSLGPGIRAVVWVRGCAFSCSGCLAPEWIPRNQETFVQVDWLVDQILISKEVSGITLSGGEPMLQAAGLLELVRSVRSKREVNIICFTGFVLDELLREPPSPEIFEFLSEIDLLVDGRYVKELNDDRGLRGSSNQKFHYLTNRLEHINFENAKRKVEISINKEFVLMKGIPTRVGLQTINHALQIKPDVSNHSIELK